MGALSKGQLNLLSYLQTHGDSPRSELAKALRLTKASITILTSELISLGLLIEKGEVVPKPSQCDEGASKEAPPCKKRGRRKVLIGVNPNYRLAVGITVQEDGISAGLTNLQGETLERAWFARESGEAGQHELHELIIKALEHLKKENCISSSRLLGLGICMTALANAAVSTALQSQHPVNVDERLLKLKKELSHAVDIPIAVSTLACGGLWARRLFFNEGSELDGDDSAVLIASGKLAGICLFANGRPYRGANGQAGGFSLLEEALANSSGDSNSSAIELAEELFPLIAFFDPSRIYGLGEAFENQEFLKTLNGELAKLFPKSKRSLSYPVVPLGVTKDKLFLCGAAVAVERLLFSFD